MQTCYFRKSAEEILLGSVMKQRIIYKSPSSRLLWRTAVPSECGLARKTHIWMFHIRNDRETSWTTQTGWERETRMCSVTQQRTQIKELAAAWREGPHQAVSPTDTTLQQQGLNPILHPAPWLRGDSFADFVGSFCLGEGRYALRARHQEPCFSSSFHDARLPLAGLLQTLLFVLICSVIKFKAFKHHPTSNWERLNWFEKNFTVLLVKK